MSDLVVFLAFQIALLPVQLLLFIGTYTTLLKIQGLYKRSLVRLVNISERR